MNTFIYNVNALLACNFTLWKLNGLEEIDRNSLIRPIPKSVVLIYVILSLCLKMKILLNFYTSPFKLHPDRISCMTDVVNNGV